MFYFEVTVDSYAVVRNNKKRSCIPFTQFFPMVTFYKTIVHDHIQNPDTNTVKIQTNSLTTRN